MTTVTRCVVLDLDDTLYLERDYVRSGFAHVGSYIHAEYDRPGFAARAWALFEQGHRNTVFDAVLEDMGLTGTIAIPTLIERYRTHAPAIALCDDAADFLDRIAGDHPLGMITDGPVASQSAKIEALGLAPRIDHIVMSDTFGISFRKPHDLPFERIETLLGGDPTEFTYIADNPLKDFITPRRRGWHTIRIRRPLGEHSTRPMAGDHAAHATVESLKTVIA